MSNYSNSESWRTRLIIIALILGGIYWLFWGEVEWEISDLDTCKVTIQKEDNVLNRIFTRYTCSYYKADNGKIIDGTCAHVKYNDNWICMKAEVYEKDSEISCPREAFVTSEWSCDCWDGYDYQNGKCISVRKCLQPNSYLSSTDNQCYCSDWYWWNYKKTECVKEEGETY